MAPVWSLAARRNSEAWTNHQQLFSSAVAAAALVVVVVVVVFVAPIGVSLRPTLPTNDICN